MNTKRMMLAVVMILTTVTVLQAQPYYPRLQNYSAKDKKRIDRGYAEALKSPNDGVVETALAVVTLLKMDLPDDEFPKIQNEVCYLKTHGATPMIRYRACLVEAVFYSPEMFKEVPTRRYSDPDTFFDAFVERMSKPYLSAN
jgi:hypothetical protein